MSNPLISTDRDRRGGTLRGWRSGRREGRVSRPFQRKIICRLFDIHQERRAGCQGPEVEAERRSCVFSFAVDGLDERRGKQCAGCDCGPGKDVIRRHAPNTDQLRAYGDFEVLVWGEEVVQNEEIEVEEWPLCDCLIAFYIKGLSIDGEGVRAAEAFRINDVSRRHFQQPPDDMISKSTESGRSDGLPTDVKQGGC